MGIWFLGRKIMATQKTKYRYLTLAAHSLLCCLLFCLICIGTEPCMAADQGLQIAADEDTLQETLEKKTEDAEKMKDKREAAQQEKRQAAKAEDAQYADIIPENITLFEDTSAKLAVSEIRIAGNTLVSTDELLKNIPVVYNASREVIDKADSSFLYDLRMIKKVLRTPGQTQQISARTIQGFTQYLLSVYKSRGHGGVYVYVGTEAFAQELELKGGILPIEILEINVSKVNSLYYSVDGSIAENQYLKPSILEEWSPAKPGEPVNEKELDDFINLLNLNPDRYVTATVSKGDEPDTLNVDYNIYEISPWHYFLQVDNAGTKDRRWSPRIGFINTNLTGRDDKLTAILQGPIDDRFSKHNYSAFASYDVPLISPRLRLNLFGGRSEFDVDGGGGISFLGNGTIWGGTLKYNALQNDGWFFDVFSGLSFEKSKVTPSLFPEFLGSEVEMGLWSVGADLHKSDDMTKSAINVTRTQRIGGDHQDAYWNPVTSTGARTDARSNFWIWTLSANHYEFLQPDKIERVLTSVRYIRPNRRLIPAKMTTFGGMYTVRGYEESAIVADGGVLASFQYEYDLVKRDQAAQAEEDQPRDREPAIKRLAPLAFFDYGRADIKDTVAGEKAVQELYSVGAGILFELNNNLSGGVYYGYPLKEAQGTRTGDGRINVYVMLQW